MFNHLVELVLENLCILQNWDQLSLRGVLDKNIQVSALLGLKNKDKPQGACYIKILTFWLILLIFLIRFFGSEWEKFVSNRFLSCL